MATTIDARRRWDVGRHVTDGLPSVRLLAVDKISVYFNSMKNFDEDVTKIPTVAALSTPVGRRAVAMEDSNRFVPHAGTPVVTPACVDVGRIPVWGGHQQPCTGQLSIFRRSTFDNMVIIVDDGGEREQGSPESTPSLRG